MKYEKSFCEFIPNCAISLKYCFSRCESIQTSTCDLSTLVGLSIRDCHKVKSLCGHQQCIIQNLGYIYVTSTAMGTGVDMKIIESSIQTLKTWVEGNEEMIVNLEKTKFRTFIQCETITKQILNFDNIIVEENNTQPYVRIILD